MSAVARSPQLIAVVALGESSRVIVLDRRRRIDLAFSSNSRTCVISLIYECGMALPNFARARL